MKAGVFQHDLAYYAPQYWILSATYTIHFYSQSKNHTLLVIDSKFNANASHKY